GSTTAAFRLRALDENPGARSRDGLHHGLLALHADDLAKLVDDLDEVGLRGHDRLDGLVGGRGLVDHRLVLATLDVLGRLGVIGQREALARLAPRHRPARAMAARAEALGVALAADDERLRAHAAGDDPQLTLAGPDGALAGHPDVGAVVVLAGHVVVVAVHGHRVR